ncbi:MAG: ABC transporter ATP-binding protein [Patescibacteria group bacterium]
MGSDELSKKARRLVLKNYYGEWRRNWRVSVPGVILPGIGNILVFYLPPYFMAKIAGLYIGGHSPTFAQLTPYVLALGGVWLAGEAVWRIALHLLIRNNAWGIQSLYIDAMRQILQKDLSFFQDNFSGSLTKKIIGYAKNFDRFMDTIAINVLANLIPLIFIAFILWHFSPLLVFVLIGMVSFTILLVLPLINHRQKLVSVREVAGNVIAGNISDTMTNMLAVQSFAKISQEQAQHTKYTKDFIGKTLKSWDYQNLRIHTVTSPLYVLINLIGLTIALTSAKGGAQSIEGIIISFSYFATFTRVLWEFNTIYKQLETDVTDSAQFTELLLDEPKIKNIPGASKLIVKDANIKFQNVTFGYEESAEFHIFKNLNLSVSPGEKIGLVGRSGGGKTTITKLLLRFMDVQSGRITIDGQNITAVTLDSLRSSIAYVPQEPVMFHRSLMENIQYGEPKASREQVISASRKAHADEFIKKLPHGYDTLVGERGTKLSGGQRQRVAIARAVLKDAPILVLDEATSALDSESEALIQDALLKLMENRTAIVIAHRLSTIQRLDRIIVLDEGSIIEQGTHQQLLKQQGTYANLWAHQSGGFLE